MNILLADVVLVLHFLVALFIAGGLLAIWAGAALSWPWIRNFWFRVLHLVATVFVAAESLAGIMCPLTVWEDLLRGSAPGETGFIQRWVSRLLYYDFPAWAFTVVYVLFALVVIATFIAIRPDRHRR